MSLELSVVNLSYNVYHPLPSAYSHHWIYASAGSSVYFSDSNYIYTTDTNATVLVLSRSVDTDASDVLLNDTRLITISSNIQSSEGDTPLTFINEDNIPIHVTITSPSEITTTSETEIVPDSRIHSTRLECKIRHYTFSNPTKLFVKTKSFVGFASNMDVFEDLFTYGRSGIPCFSIKWCCTLSISVSVSFLLYHTISYILPSYPFGV